MTDISDSNIDLSKTNDNSLTSGSELSEIQNPDSQKFIQIGTLNVQGLNNIMTQQQIIDFANNYQFDILGLTKIRHSLHNQFHILKNNLNQNPNNKEFTYYWTKGSETHNHGVGIMIEKQLNKHVYSIQTFENHAITLDMTDGMDQDNNKK
ncbi:20862_t:CDS:2, partial [Dentiscutata erythropus]